MASNTDLSNIDPVRYKLLLSRYAEAKLYGQKLQYDIQAVDDNLEHYYIVFRAPSGLYRDQIHILELRTTYGHNNEYRYPQKPPRIQFKTNNFHTNVNPTTGTICVDFVYNESQWMPSYTFLHIIQAVQLLYMQPETDSAHLNGEATNLHVECEKQFKSMCTPNMTVSDREFLFNECFERFKTHADNIWRNGTPYTSYSKFFPGLSEIPPRYWPTDESVQAIAQQYAAIAGQKAFQRLLDAANPQTKKATQETQATQAAEATQATQATEAQATATQATEAAATQAAQATRPVSLKNAPKPKRR